MSVHWGGKGPGHVSRWPRGVGAISPYSGATMLLDFLNPVLDPRITFSRGTNATLIDSTGRLTYAPNNLLLRTTLEGGTAGVLGSGAVAPTGWSFQINTGSISYPPALNGSGTASRFVATAQRPFIAQNFTVVANSSYIFSVYVDAVASGSSALQDNIFASGLPVGSTTTYYVNGVLAGFSDVIVAGTRVSILINVGSTGGLTTFRIGLGGAGSVTGDVTLSAPQLEQVTYQTTPSTYVATTASAYYGPRFDYDPVTLAPRGLLIEEARTNLLTYSDQFNNAIWQLSDVTVSANATSSPEGIANADNIVENTATALHRISTGSTFNLTSGVTYTASVYAKNSGRRYLNINWGAGFNARSTFDLQAGTIASTASGTATITNAGNGWYRCTITGTATVTGAATGYLQLNNSTSSGDVSYTGDGVSGIYLYGAQLEAGSFATSYIPTVASTVTRNADVATMTGTNFSSWYNQSEGTFAAQYDSYLVDTSTRSALSAYASGATANNILFINAVQRQFQINNAGNQADLDGGTPASGAVVRAAGAYKVNDFALSLDGGAVVTDTVGTVPTVDTLGIGISSLGLTPVNGHVRTIAYFNTRLPNDRLVALSR